MIRVDVHQHLWTRRLCEALARRDAPPRLRPDGAGWVLELAGEEPFALRADDPARRSAVLDEFGVDLTVVALSAALGIETLPEVEARELLAAWDDDADDLPRRLPAWGSVALESPSPDDVAVDLGGERVPKVANAGSGWSYGTERRTVTLSGTWCDRLKSGGANDLVITFGCPGVPVP